MLFMDKQGKNVAGRCANSLRKPAWLKVELGGGAHYAEVAQQLSKEGLHTICASGRCPNQGECWRAGTATFMILGDICTRSCRFCATAYGRPLPPTPDEAQRVARSIRLMRLRHAVVTSVDRDDLPDGGAAQWVELVETVRRECPGVTIEVLLPDFKGKGAALERVLATKPDIAAHNMETVARLTPQVRSKAEYANSLEVVARIAQSGVVAKSGLMLGLGERQEEVLETMRDLRQVGCEVLTIGQYLRPREENWPVDRYVTPEEFELLKEEGLAMGFTYVESGPLVRSSFRAASALEACGIAKGR